MQGASKKSEKKEVRSGLSRFFVRGLITLGPAILTIVIFGLLLQVIDRYITGPINSVIYWTLEENTLGWVGLKRLGVDPFDKAYLDPELLPLDLQDVARSSTGGFSAPEFQDRLARYREHELSFFVDLDALGVNAARLRSDVKRLVPPYVGVALSFLVVLWLGWLMGGFVGRRIVQRLDRMMHLIPVVNAVYPYSKQLVEFFFADRKMEFDTVVIIPYPSEGLWSIAFVTSSSLKSLRDATGKTMVTVFIPSSPMPMTGYTIFIEAHRVIPMSLSVDEALRITMTGGVLIPPRERIRVSPMDTILAVEADEESPDEMESEA